MGEPRSSDGGLGRMLQRAFLLRLMTLFVTTLSYLGHPPTLFVLMVTMALTIASLLGIVAQRQLSRWCTRHPALVLADVLATMSVMGLVGVRSPLVLSTLTTAFIVGLLLDVRIAAVVVLAMTGSYVLALLRTPATVDFLTLAVVPLMYASLFAIGEVYRRSSREQDRIWQEIARAEGDRSAADERARLAREMHDSLAKTLHGIAISATALPHWVEHDQERAAGHARALADGAEQAAAEARAILVRMRVDQPDRPLAEVLGDLCARWQQENGVRCEFEAIGIADVSHEVRYELAAVVAEALDNVRRHAGATSVQVRLRRMDHHLDLVVVDDGVGLRSHARASNRFGLQGMAERASAVGGELYVGPAGDKGTKVRMTVPWALREALA